MDVFTILLTFILIAIIVIDLREQIIPDVLNLALTVLGVAAIVFNHPSDELSYGISAVALGGIGALLAGPYSKWRGRDMLGWGDVKFLAAAGLWLLPQNIGYFLFIAGALGALFSIIYRIHTKRAETPFAPALCISLWIMVMLENHLALGVSPLSQAAFPTS